MERIGSFAAIIAICGICCTFAGAQTVSWSRINGPYSGSIQSLTLDQAGNVYVATFTGIEQIYRSTDRGESWQRVLGLLSYGFDTALATDSANNIYYGDMDVGLYKSTDRGTSWFKTSLPGGASAISAISGSRLCVGGFQTVSISNDAGKTWFVSQVRADCGYVSSIAEGSLGDIYVGYYRSFGRFPCGGGVYISSDGGKTWQLTGMASDSIESMAVDKSGKVFALASDGAFTSIYSLTPGNGSWKEDAAGIPLGASIGVVQIDRSTEAIAMTDMGVYVYDDVLSGWKPVVKATLSGAAIKAALYDHNGISYLGTENDGIFFLDKSASTWVQCGIYPAAIMSLGMDNDGNLYAGTDGGIFEKEHHSGHWLRTSDGLGKATVYQIRWSVSNKILYAATAGGLFYLPDSGNFWIPLTKQWIYDFVETPTAYYAGTPGGIFEAANGLGAGWGPLSTVGLPLTSIYCLALDSSGNLYAGTKHDGVFVSSGDRTFWWQVGISSPIIFSGVKTLEVDYMGRMFAGTNSSGAYCSDDSGETWKSVSTISGKNVTSFLVDFPSRYLAGTYERGIFLSTDRGLSWEPENTGLADSNVTALLLDNLGYIYAGTDGGLFKSDRVVTAIRENKPTASSFHLFQNYPNPFNPSTTIMFNVPSSGFVSLKVYDALGREVKTLVQVVKKMGRYEVEFDASKLSSGVYFYRLTAGDYGAVKKMVVIK